MARMHAVVAVVVFLAAAVAATPAPEGVVPLETFDGSKTAHPWTVVNDPVMGGVSRSTFVIDKATQTMNWTGEVRIVPKLAAPGFCNLETTNQLLSKFNDVSDTSHLLLHVRTTAPTFAGFKFSFAAHTLDPQFKSFKANFNFSLPNPGWTTLAIPWDRFSNNWSPFTGNCDTKDPTGTQHFCCSPQHPEVCPKPSDLSAIQALGLWTEGASGNFTLDVAWIGAGNPAALLGQAPRLQVLPQAENRSCTGAVQPHLRYNISGRLAKDTLPFPFTPTETLVEAVCCDREYADFAEPQDFFARLDVALFQHLSKEGVTTFYDPVCGVPLFRAPVNRTLAAWKAETQKNNWPSFRQAEAIVENLVITPTGQAYSKCGTHLGDQEHDDQGLRYCIDLSCISGNPINSVIEH